MEKNYKQFRDSVYGLTEDYQLINIETGRVKMSSTTKSGYVLYALYLEGKTRTTYLHRIVWEIFYGRIPQGMEIDHLDKDVSNNHISNINVVSRKENQYRARNKYSDTRGVNQSNGYYRLYYNNTYVKGSNCKTLEQIKKFKKEYDKKHNPLDNLI